MASTPFRDMETAPRDETAIEVWHGPDQAIVRAEWSGQAQAWMRVDDSLLICAVVERFKAHEPIGRSSVAVPGQGELRTMRQYELIALGMLLASIVASAKAQDAMVQQKPAEKNQPIAGSDKAAANGKQANAASKLTDKSTDATITDPANPVAHANTAKQ